MEFMNGDFIKCVKVTDDRCSRCGIVRSTVQLWVFLTISYK